MSRRAAEAEQLGIALSSPLKCAAIGLPTWILVNGTWSALSGMADKAPEGFAISAYLMLCLSTGNLCPILMNAYVLRGLSPRGLLRVVLLLDVVGLLAGLAMAVSWQWTLRIASEPTSLYLFVCFLIVGASSSAANVAKYMLVANLSSAHTSHLSTGIALGSMLAGLTGIARGFTQDMGFSVTIYVFLLCAAYIPSIGITLSIYRKGRTLPPDSYSAIGAGAGRAEGEALLPPDSPEEGKAAGGAGAGRRVGRGFCCFNGNDMQYFSAASSTRNFLLVQALMAGLGFGLVPAVLSTVCAKFRSPYTVLLLAAGISCIIDPIGRYLTASRSLETHAEVYGTAGFLGGLATLLLLLGCLPSNPLYRAALGGMLPAALYVAFIPIFGFLNTSVFLIMKREAVGAADGGEGGDEKQHSIESDLVRLCGVMTQTGAMIGSITSFIVIFLFL
jgi:hypothetical protein